KLDGDVSHRLIVWRHYQDLINIARQRNLNSIDLLQLIIDEKLNAISEESNISIEELNKVADFYTQLHSKHLSEAQLRQSVHSDIKYNNINSSHLTPLQKALGFI